LASIYCNNEIEKAEVLMKDIKMPGLIEDTKELSKLESELALSKIKNESEELSKK